jgi:hypothetical protein
MNLSFLNNFSDSTNNGNFGFLGVGARNAVTQPETETTMDTETITPQINTGFGGGDFWSKDGGAGIALGSVGVLGNLWNSYQQQKIAKDQLKFAKNQWNTNLSNQKQTYNTALEDRIRSRHAYSGKSEDQTEDYLNKHRL